MTLLKTPLYDWHKNKANMVPFAGFEMPVVYKSPSSISIEHNVIRNHAGLFDVSHMGRMLVSGKNALEFINLLVPRDLKTLQLHKVAYTYFLNELAGFRDDITVAKMGEFEYLITWNAGNLWKIWHWTNDLASIYRSQNNADVQIKNITGQTAMIAFQGPKAPELTEKMFGLFPGSWKVSNTKYKGIEVSIFGSGYTGESGCEIIIYNTSLTNPEHAITIWEDLLSLEGVMACGLGARDTLRTEAGMPLYGNDINENINPIEAGLAFPPLINFDKDYFIGKEALLKLKAEENNLLKRVGLIAIKKGPAPRPGMKLYHLGKEIGFVSSGSFSPLLKIGIGMGFIPNSFAMGEELIAKDTTSDKEINVKISPFPLYNSEEFGSKRKK